VIETIGQGPLEDVFEVSISKRCGWFGAPRRSFSYHPVKGAPKVKSELEAPAKSLVNQKPSFGYRTLAWLLGMALPAAERHDRARDPHLKVQCVHRRRLETSSTRCG
jgi:putative transposase